MVSDPRPAAGQGREGKVVGGLTTPGRAVGARVQVYSNRDAIRKAPKALMRRTRGGAKIHVLRMIPQVEEPPAQTASIGGQPLRYFR
jgi:hypothetical protein